MPMIPENALERPVRDFYADLSPEEREAEGLPPAEEPKKEVAPVAKEEPKPTPAAAEPEPEEDEVSTEDVLAEIAKIGERLDAAIGGPGPSAKDEKESEDALLKAGLEHDDPVVRGLAQKLSDQKERLAGIEKREEEQAIERQMLRDDADFEAVQKNYLIGGAPMTDAQVEKVEKFMKANPLVCKSLSIEAITRVVFADAVRVGTKGAPPAPPAKGAAPDATQPVATIVDTGTSGGASAGTRKPQPHKDIESAVQAAGRRFGWVP